MNIDSMFPSAYLKASDCSEGNLVLTIKKITQEGVGQGRNAEVKPVIYFDETDKGLVLNKTNAGIISEMYGKNTDTWTGKKIILYETEVSFQGEMVQAIRIKRKEITSGNYVPPPTAEAWTYYYDLATQAEQLGLNPADPPNDISARDLHKTCKALKEAIALAGIPESEPD